MINAGDGRHAHPTQALLDALTLRRHRELAGLRVAIVGDVRHSRVARSNVKALHLLGADVTLVAPPTLLPESLEGWPVQVSHDLDDVISEVDVVMLLRMQFERQAEALFPTVREYTARYGLTEARAERLKPDALIMHPGPMNRGVEVAAVGRRRPRLARHRTGRQRRRRPHGRALHPPRKWCERLSEVLDQGRSRRRRDRRARRRRAGPRRQGRRRRLPTCTTTGDVLEAQRVAWCRPGFVDLHVHLREPGDEEAETIETGTRAAARGGFTAVVAMPNTRPALDDAAVVSSVLALGKQAGLCDVVSSGCITVARAGEQLAPMGELYALGVRIFTDDGFCVASAGVMRRALEYAASLPGAIVAQHAEDETLAAGGHMHEGAWSSRLGIPGRPSVAETVIVARDIELCEVTGTPVHFLHCSAAGTVALVRAAKARGLPVTAECAPHHFSLTDECCEGFDPMFKVHPPLRTQADVDAIREGLADGTIDAIATDHAPHTPESKERPFEEAPPGMLGLETALAVTLTELVEPGHLAACTMPWRCLSWRPAAIAGLDAARRTHRAGCAGEPDGRSIPAHEWVGGTRRAGEPRSQHAVRRAHAEGQGASTRCSSGTWSCATAEATR